MNTINISLNEKVVIDSLPKAYLPLLDIKFDSAEKLNQITKDRKIPLQTKDITYICDVCGKPFINDLSKFRTLFTSKFSLGILICGGYMMSPLCHREKQRRINTYREEHNCSPAKGRILSEEEKTRAKEKRGKNEKYREHMQNRVGKTLKDLYGEEKSKEIRQVIREKRLEQKDPRLGTTHSTESKKRMSEKRKQFLAKGERKFESPITGEMLSYNEWHSDCMKFSWANKSEEEKQQFREKYIARYLDKGMMRKKFASGYYTTWYNKGTDKEGKKDEVFLSSYELRYFMLLDEQRIYYKTNRSIFIPYQHPKDNSIHYYVPDILIYEDASLSKITTIIEVKPEEFVNNPKNKKGLYYKITAAKLNALTEYCKSSNIEMKIITEKELGLPKDMNKAIKMLKELLNDYYENKKDNT